MPNKASRLLTLILILQRQPGKKAAELAKELGISVRSLHRYLSALDDMGIPIYSERGPLGGFSLLRGYKMPPLMFSLEEAAAVSLGTSLVGELWGNLYQEPARSALVKIDNLLPDEQRAEVSWARQAMVVSGLHRFNLDSMMNTLEILRRAVHDRKGIYINYLGNSQLQPTERQIDPYALVYRWGWWYVVGYCHLRAACRTFRVDRIQEMHTTDRLFIIPDDFDIHQYLESEPRFVPQIKATILFNAEAQRLAHSIDFMGLSLQDQPDGTVLATFLAYDLDFAAQMIMSFGPLVKVVSPPELKKMVVEYAEQILINYQDY